jgi:hypothetical protein
MIIQFVKFQSGLTEEEVRRTMEARAPQFRALPGLLQKYYGRERDTGQFCGIYLWDSEASLAEFKTSELARTIPIAYAVTSPPRAEIFDVLLPLRTTEPANTEREPAPASGPAR